ncbi:response regulator transcription factor [Phormidium tenue FACHB-886]|nr:response regulator transcription factor [Phormidium tenue FACHB-886]
MNNIRVALIEDHDLTRMGLRIMLEQWDENTVTVVGEATNGRDGLELLTTTQPDIAIIDIGLPLLDGIELTQQFKQLQADLEQAEAVPTKILILTMQDNEQAVLAAFSAGADSYCMKDLNKNLLLRAVQNTYEGNHWIDPAIARIVLQHNQKLQPMAAPHNASRPLSVEINADDDYTEMLAVTPLTVRELEILELIVAGCSNADIASRCYITVGTVKTHVRNILNKLSADDRTQAAVRGLRAGLVT